MRAHRRAESDRQSALLPELVGASELAYASRARFAYEPHFDACFQAAENAEQEVQRLERRHDAATCDAATCDAATQRAVLAGVYTDPEFAGGRLVDYQRQHEEEHVRKILDKAPEEFGTLRKLYPWWWWANSSTAPAPPPTVRAQTWLSHWTTPFVRSRRA